MLLRCIGKIEMMGVEYSDLNHEQEEEEEEEEERATAIW